MSGDDVESRRLGVWASLVVLGATLGGCGFLDEDLRLSERAFEASFDTERARARLEGTGAGGGGSGAISIGCGGALGHVGYGHGDSSLPDVRELRFWYRRYCRGDGSAMCRQLRRELAGVGRSSNAVLAYVDGEEDEEEDERE